MTPHHKSIDERKNIFFCPVGEKMRERVSNEDFSGCSGEVGEERES
jgi:hypothetical protein